MISIALFVLGFLLSYFLSGKQGQNGLIPNIVVGIRSKKVILHHWLTFSFGLLILNLFSISFLNPVIIGAITHGLTYKDRFNFYVDP